MTAKSFRANLFPLLLLCSLTAVLYLVSIYIFFSAALVVTIAWNVMVATLELNDFRHRILISSNLRGDRYIASLIATRLGLRDALIDWSILYSLGYAIIGGMTWNNADPNSLLVLWGFSVILGAVMFGILGLKVPQWLGYYPRSKLTLIRDSTCLAEQAVKDLSSLSTDGASFSSPVIHFRYQVRVAIGTHFSRVFFLLLPFYVGLKVWSYIASVLIGCVFGYVYLYVVHQSRQRFRSHRGKVTLLASSYMSLISAIMFTQGMGIADESWNLDLFKTNYGLYLISFFGWFGICLSVQAARYIEHYRIKDSLPRKTAAVRFSKAVENNDAVLFEDTVRVVNSTDNGMLDVVVEGDDDDYDENESREGKDKNARAGHATDNNLLDLVEGDKENNDNDVANDEISRHVHFNDKVLDAVVDGGNEDNNEYERNADSNDKPRRVKFTDNVVFDAVAEHSNYEDEENRKPVRRHIDRSRLSVFYQSVYFDPTSVSTSEEFSRREARGSVLQNTPIATFNLVVASEASVEAPSWFRRIYQALPIKPAWDIFTAFTCFQKNPDSKSRSCCIIAIFIIFRVIVISLNMLAIYIALVACAATVQITNTKAKLPYVSEKIYKNMNFGPVCAFDSIGGDIRTFASMEEAHLANFQVAHCGACGHCSNWIDLELQWSTRKTLAQQSQKCSIQTLGKGISALQECLEGPTIGGTHGFTSECARCWAEDIMCTKGFCVFIFLQTKMTNQVGNFKVGPNDITSATCEEASCEAGNPGSFVECVGANRRRMNIKSDIERPGGQICSIVDVDSWDDFFPSN